MIQFLIEIRHIASGMAKAFASLQEVADFLADKVAAEWEGFQHLGELPAPTVAEPVAEVAAPAPAGGSDPAPDATAEPEAPAAPAVDAPAQDSGG